jgi:anti-anti-sigma factor
MFRAIVTHCGDRTEIRLAGTLDQTTGAEFSRAFETIRGTVCLNLREVIYISSYGIGLLMRQLAAINRDHKVEFAECSETMVDQFQMLEFSSYGRITSFQARYACARCGRPDVVLLDISRDLEVDVVARTVRSPEFSCTCGGRLTVDDSLDFVVEHV